MYKHGRFGRHMTKHRAPIEAAFFSPAAPSYCQMTVAVLEDSESCIQKISDSMIWSALLLFLLLLIASRGILFFYESRPNQEDIDLYPEITYRMTEPEVSAKLGLIGEKVEPQHWPQKLGDIPRFKNGDLVVGPEERIGSVIWREREKKRWLAAGFVNLFHGGSLSAPIVVVKRSGELEHVVDVPAQVDSLRPSHAILTSYALYGKNDARHRPMTRSSTGHLGGQPKKRLFSDGH